MDRKQIANDIVDAARCGKRWFPHDLWTQLRAQSTLAWLEPDGHEGFWAIVKHADLKEISTQPDKFSSEQRSIIMPRERWKQVKSLNARGLIDMDPPDHRHYRKLVNTWFTPRNIRRLEDRMRESALQLVDMMAEAGTWQGDFTHPLMSDTSISLTAATALSMLVVESSSASIIPK